MPSKTDRTAVSACVVSTLYIYPVKSLGGISVPQAVVEERGFRHDRRWMIVDEQGVFLTQRTHPKMALIKAAVQEDSIELHTADGRDGRSALPIQTDTGERVLVQVWGDTVRAVWPRLETDAWISDFLDVDCRLVYMPDMAVRKADARYDPGNSEVSFADAFPYLLASSPSLEDLKRRSGADLDMRRFRPNIVISGCDAFDEDHWKAIRIASTKFRLVKPCARCVVTTLDPDTGARGKEPLRTLATYRNKDGKTLFGQNMVAEDRGTVMVGDTVEVLQQVKDA